MRTIAELIAGVSDAGNGTAEIYTRNGGATATWYEDFEGTVAHTTGDAVSLDSNGAAEVYVNQEVLVRVKDSTGTVVRDFTSAGAAPGMEVNSQSFTGADYKSGQTGVNKPTTAQSIFDLWKTNAGGIDWNVLTHAPTSASQSLKAIGATHHRVFVVTDPAYGATGDGTTDDTVAINAALAAATTAGGGLVYFPPGTYRVTATLGTVGAGTDILGAGQGESIISMDDATAGVFNYAAGTANLYQRISNLAISFQQANTGYAVQQAADVWLIIDNCLLGNGAFSNGAMVKQTDSTCKTVLLRSFLLLGTAASATSQWVAGDTTGGDVWILFCNFAAPTASWSPTNGGVNAFEIICIGSTFTMSPLTGGAGTILLAPAGGTLRLALNDFGADGSGNFAAAGLAAAPTAAARIFDLGNIVNCSSGIGVTDPGSDLDERVLLMTRDSRVFYTAVTAGTPSPALVTTREAATFVFEMDGVAYTYNGAPHYEGQKLTLVWIDNAGGSGSLDLGANYKWEGATTLTSGQDMTAHFIAVRDASNSDALTFYQVGTRLKV